MTAVVAAASTPSEAASVRFAALRPIFDGDPVIEAVWLYHHEGLNQAEAAERLGVSRATVHNLLRAAEARGLVRVAIDCEHMARGELALALAERFGLDRALVVPDAKDAAPGSGALEQVARAAALWLADLTRPDDVLGVAWGQTVHLIAEAAPRRPRPGMRVVQLVGSMASPFGFSAEACAIGLARAFGAECVTLHAPAVVSSADFARRLAAEPIIAAQLAKLGDCTTALFTVGVCDADAHILRAGVVTAEELAEARKAGAAGVIAGRFIDVEGRALKQEVDARLIGVRLEALREIPRRILVCAGPGRRRPLHAALCGGFASVLVTDAAMARALLHL